jgi:class 3 adenylate cyclase
VTDRPCECELINGKHAGIAVTTRTGITELACPSQVLVSQTVRDLLVPAEPARISCTIAATARYSAFTNRVVHGYEVTAERV